MDKSIGVRICPKEYAKLTKAAIKDGIVKKNGEAHLGNILKKIIAEYLSR